MITVDEEFLWDDQEDGEDENLRFIRQVDRNVSKTTPRTSNTFPIQEKTAKTRTNRKHSLNDFNVRRYLNINKKAVGLMTQLSGG